jgi:hexosaminidase
MLLPLMISAAFAADPALMPMPATVRPADGRLLIDANFSVSSTLSGPRLDAAIHRLVALVSRETGIPMSGKPAPGNAVTLTIVCAAPAPAIPALDEDESYTLEVAGGATLRSATTTGALRGLATFAQLIVPGPDGFEIRGIRIEDHPRFAWRGLMLDVSRHWMPLEVVLRNLDAMAAVKLNVFHWHLSDDQGFRVESKLYPKLQQFGSDGNYYTQDEIRQVIAYAGDRGIRVVPEFDIPGHTSSWFPGYPELTAAPGIYEIGRHFGVFDPVIDPTREDVYAFLDGFLGEMAQLFPDSYFHIGGDEVNGRQWSQSQHVQAFMKQHGLADSNALQVYFNRRISAMLEKRGKIVIGWDEVLQPNLPMGTVIHSWRGQASLADAAVKGYRAILSWGYYLDHLNPARYHYGIDPLAGAAANLTPEQAARVLGGEACMWSELVDAENVDSRIWPRTAAIAERFWSPPQVTGVDSMYARMETVSRLLALGVPGMRHRAAEGPMLDRLSGGRPAPSVRVLAQASEALGLGPRRGSRYTSLTPLNRFVDAIPPESETVRALELAGARLVANPATDGADALQLRAQFAVWVANDAAFQPLAEANVLLAELKPLSQDLSALGATGMQALDYLAKREPAPAEWIARQQQEFKRMLRPDAEVTLAAVRPVRILVEALAKTP